MDIRNFFTKKIDKENGGELKRPTAAAPVVSKEKKSTKPQQKSNGDSKRSRNNDVDDEDDVIVIDSPIQRKKIQPNRRTNSAEVSRRKAPAKPKTQTSKKNDSAIFLDDSSFDNDDDEDFVPTKASPLKKQKVVAAKAPVPRPSKTESPKIARSSPRTGKRPPTADPTPSPQPVKKRAPAPSKASTTEPRPAVLQPNISQDDFDIHLATPQCLAGRTFCLSGIMPNLSRDEASEMIKILGGRVTTAVSSKTTYLVLGDVLEDGRSVDQGSKYTRANAPESTTILVHGMERFYGLLQQYSDSNCSSKPSVNSIAAVEKIAPSAVPEKSAVVSANGSHISTSLSTPAVVPKSNPYATATASASATALASNPYARKSNPYAKKPPVTVATKPATTSSSRIDDRKMPAKTDKSSHDTTQLWVDKYKPTHSSEILGNQDAVRKLSVWLASWEECFNSSNHKVKSFSAPNGPWKAALLSGPPGIGSK